MPKTRPAFTQEFRDNAVRLVRSSGKSRREIAKDLGCSENSLREWAKRTDLDAGKRKDGLTSEEREEFAKLRRQVKVLEEERAILLKAAAFFATETGRTR